jgi:site-specific DNA-cytosine methylase
MAIKVQPFVIDQAVLDLIGNEFRFDHAKGLAEWLKNSSDAYLREGVPDADQVMIVRFTGTGKSLARIECIDFVGMSKKQIDEAFKRFFDPQAAKKGAKQANLKTLGGHGNGGKFYMRIVALREDLGISNFAFPNGSYDAMDIGRDSHTDAKANCRFVSVESAIGDLPELTAGEGFDGCAYTRDCSTDYQCARRENSIALFNHVARTHSRRFLEKISAIQPGQGNAQLPDGERFSDNYFSQAYARLHPHGIGFTITAHFRNPGSGRFTHYRDNRSITVREAARLQSFDDRFIFCGCDRDQERHVGNAVPPLVAEALARHFGSLVCSA